MPRPIGSKNQKTKEWEAFGHELITGGMPRLRQILDTCDDDTFIRVYISLLEYFKPKLKRVEIDPDSDQVRQIVVIRQIEDAPGYSPKS